MKYDEILVAYGDNLSNEKLKLPNYGEVTLIIRNGKITDIKIQENRKVR